MSRDGVWWSMLAIAACVIVLTGTGGSRSHTGVALSSGISSSTRSVRSMQVSRHPRMLSRSPRGCTRLLRRPMAANNPIDDEDGAAEVRRLIRRDRDDYKKLFAETEEDVKEREEYVILDKKTEEEKREVFALSDRAEEGEVGAPVSAATILNDAAAPVSPFADPERSPFDAPADEEPAKVSPFADPKRSPFADDSAAMASSSSSSSPFADTKVSPFADPSSSPFDSPKASSSPFGDIADNPFQQMEDAARAKRGILDQGFPTAAQPAPGTAQRSELADSTPWYENIGISLGLILSFATIFFLLLTTVGVVFKLGGIHYDDMQ